MNIILIKAKLLLIIRISDSDLVFKTASNLYMKKSPGVDLLWLAQGPSVLLG